MEATHTLPDKTAENVILRSTLMAERAPLTNDVLPRIMAGEFFERPIIQIMSAKLYQYKETLRLVLLACDGKWTEHVSCSPELTELLLPVVNKLKLSIVQLDKYAITEDRIEISEMSWLNFGSDICFSTNLLQHRATLTEGFFDNFIGNYKRMPDPIVKVLKIKTIKNSSENKERVCLVIHDGQDSANAYLSTQLEKSLRGALTKRSIVRLDTYKMNYVNFERNSITVFALTLLNEGSFVDFMWSPMPAAPALTDTFIRSLVIGDLLAKPVVKIVKVNLFFNRLTSKTQIRVLIYDGIKTCHAILPESMNYLKDRLDQLPIVCLEKYVTQDKRSNGRERMLVVYEMTGLSLEGHSEVPSQYELRLMRASLPKLYN